MDVIFRTNTLRKCYELEGEAERKWGSDVGKLYAGRIDILRAISNIDELHLFQSLHYHKLTGPRRGQRSITIQGLWRVILVPGPGNTEITVHEVVDYHEE